MSSHTSEILDIIAIGALIMCMLIEMMLSETWNKTYFMIGLHLLTVRVPVGNHHVNIPSEPVLEAQFESGQFGYLAFREISPKTFGFHEKLLQSWIVHRLTIMHGVIIFDDVNSQVIVKGFANWSWFVLSIVLLGKIAIILFSATMIETIPFLFFFVLLVSGPFFRYSWFSEIASIAAQAWSRKHVNNKTGA